MTADAALARLLRGVSVEVTARNRDGASLARAHLAPGTEIYLASIRGETHHLVAAAAAMAGVGFVPVPHLAARGITSSARLDDLLARLHGEAGVERVLVIGGDIDRPAGPYHAALDLLRTGLFARHAMRRIGIAVHPEPHGKVAATELRRAVVDKLAVIAEQGMAAWLVSQFSFDAAPVLALARTLRAAGVAAPLRIGITGPADQHTLVKYALHCGIGNSIRALGTHADMMANVMRRRAPDALLHDLARAASDDPGLGIEGIHIFTFGGIAATAHWLATMLPPPRGAASGVVSAPF